MSESAPIVVKTVYASVFSVLDWLVDEANALDLYRAIIAKGRLVVQIRGRP